MLSITGFWKQVRCVAGPSTILIVCLALAGGSHAASTEHLTLSDAIGLALKNNLGVEIERLGTDIETARIDAARGAFEPTINMRAVHEDIQNPQNQRELNASQSPARLFTEDNYLLEGSLEGLLPLGTQWSVVAEADRLKNSLNTVRPPSLFFPEYDSFVGFRLTQPLFRDFRHNAQVTAVRIAATDREIADLGWNLRLQIVIAEVIKNYYDLIFAREDAGVKREAIDLALELKGANEKRLEQGVASPVEVRQAEVAVSVREEALLSSEHFYRERENVLAREIYRDFDLTDPPRISPTGGLSASAAPTDRDALMATALSNRVEYLGVMKQIEKENIQIKFAKNQSWPRIDLVGTIGGNGLADGYGGTINDAFDEDGTQWSVGIVVSIPLGNRTARARVRENELEKKQLILSLKRAEVDIAVQIDTALSRIVTSQQRLETASKSAGLARETLEQEDKRLTQGVTDSFQVLEAQREFAEARSRELAARADLSKSMVDLWGATGTLLPQYGITLGTAGSGTVSSGK